MDPLTEKEYYRGKRVLITGGLGFIGSNIAIALSKLGASVAIVDNLDPRYGGNKFNIHPVDGIVETLICDVRDEKKVIPQIEKADLLIHLAAQVSYVDSIDIPLEDMDVNAGSMLRILDWCRRLNIKSRILFASSRMVYGKPAAGVIYEESTTCPNNIYAVHKLAAEGYLRNFDQDYTILRLTNPYGPRQPVRHGKYSLVGWMIAKALRGEEISVFGDGGQLRDYVFIDDVVSAFLKLGMRKSASRQTVNVGSGVSTRFKDMVGEVVRCAGKGIIKNVPWPDNYKRIETGDYMVDIGKLEGITGWRPGVPLPDGIGRTCAYYSENLPRYL